MVMTIADLHSSLRAPSKAFPFPVLALRKRLAEQDDSTSTWGQHLPSLLRHTCNNLCNEGNANLLSGKEKGSTLQIAGRVWPLSQCPQGCRQVQSILDTDLTHHEQLLLINELRGHVLEAMWCHNANHVLQKIIITGKPSDVQFIIDEIESSGENTIRRASRQRFGCRIIQRVLEHCTSAQVSNIANVILSEVVMLTKHAHGKFVVQALLKHGTDDHVSRILSEIMLRAEELVLHPNGCSVFCKALECGEVEQQVSLARAITDCASLIDSKSGTRQLLMLTRHTKRVLQQNA